MYHTLHIITDVTIIEIEIVILNDNRIEIVIFVPPVKQFVH